MYPAVTCQDLLSPNNGQITFTTDTTAPFDYGTEAAYSCDTGYGLNADVPTTRTCVGDGSSPDGMWSGSPPSCNGESHP